MIKKGQIYQNFLGQTFEVVKIEGNKVYGIGRSRQGTRNSVIETCTKEDLKTLELVKGK